MAIMGKKLIAACSTAIGIIYAAGYVSTLTQASVINQTAISTQIDQNITVNPEQNTPQASPTESTQASSSQKYKDGTYEGSGTNRFGTVQVAVTIKEGKIAAVEITDCHTRYSQNYIDPLPQEIVDTQSSDIQAISGATRSSEDFIQAVIEALNQSEQA
jgi:uncharacterized protein with FMN-binding domain